MKGRCRDYTDRIAHLSGSQQRLGKNSPSLHLPQPAVVSHCLRQALPVVCVSNRRVISMAFLWFLKSIR